MADLSIYSFDYLIQRALSRVPDTIDKRQGSIIYDALAPAMLELSLFYLELQKAQTGISVDKAVGIDLAELAYQNGVIKKAATFSVRKGTFNKPVDIGSKFSIENINYTVSYLIAAFDYALTCDIAGEIGNAPIGALMPISYIDDLTVANLGDIIVSGSDEETDEQLRERYKQNIILPPQDGNAAQYLLWASQYPDIGIAKVFPLWNGGNTVKVAITNRLFLPAEQSLVNSFQNYIDPGSKGFGNGVAPIGSKVTVTGGIKKNITVSANVILNEGYTAVEGATEALTSYLASIVYTKGSVSFIRIGGALLDCPSILDLNSLKLNTGVVDIPLVGEEIPVLTSLNLTVVVA